jgi:hypothetical protein
VLTLVAFVSAVKPQQNLAGYEVADFAFPKTIDPEIFTTPSPPPARS